MIDTYTVRRNLDGVVTVAGMMIAIVVPVLVLDTHLPKTEDS